MGGVRADAAQRAGRGGWRPGWLLGVVVMAVTAGLALDQSGVADELVWLGKVGRWTAHHNPDSVGAVAVASDGGVWAGTNAAGLVRWHADGSYRRHVPARVAGQPVRHVAVADDGTVWAAVSSWRGEPLDRLLRFDGHRWRAEPVLGDDAANAQVESLAVGDDAVWVATDQGLARFDGDEWTTPHTGDDGSPLRVSAVVVDDDGVMWAAVYGAQPRVIRFDGPHSSTVWPTDGQTDGGPPLAGETPLAVGADGSVWVATVERSHDPGARVRPWRFADGEWVAAAPGFDAPRGWVRAFTVDDDGQPWIAVGSHADGGDRKPLWHFDGRRWQRHGRRDGLPHDMVGSLAADNHGVVWAATVNGVARFADGEWTHRVTDDGPASDFVADLATGQEAEVWTAGSSGVSRFDGQQWTTWDADGVGEEFADHVSVGPDGGVWAATRDDVFRFDGERWTAQPTGSHLDDVPVQSLAVGPTGAVWVGAEGHVARFDGQQWTTWTAADGLPHHDVRSLAIAENGQAWAATAGGVAHFDGGSWERFTNDDGLPASSVTAVALGAGPRVWAGTKQGLARYDGQRWAHADTATAPLAFDGDPPAAHDPVVAVTTGDDGTVWAATEEALSAFDGWQWHTTPLETVTVPDARALAVDDAAAWVASPRGRGLARFDRDASGP